MTERTLTISRTSSGDGDYITVALRDGGTQIKGYLSLKDYALLLTGRSEIPLATDSSEIEK